MRGFPTFHDHTPPHRPRPPPREPPRELMHKHRDGTGMQAAARRAACGVIDRLSPTGPRFTPNQSPRRGRPALRLPGLPGLPGRILRPRSPSNLVLLTSALGDPHPPHTPALPRGHVSPSAWKVRVGLLLVGLSPEARVRHPPGRRLQAHRQRRLGLASRSQAPPTTARRLHATHSPQVTRHTQPAGYIPSTARRSHAKHSLQVTKSPARLRPVEGVGCGLHRGGAGGPVAQELGTHPLRTGNTGWGLQVPISLGLTLRGEWPRIRAPPRSQRTRVREPCGLVTRAARGSAKAPQ